MAREANADLTKKPAKDFVDGPDGLAAALEAFHVARVASFADLTAALSSAAAPAQAILASWRAQHDDFVQRLRAKELELRSQGLTIQAGELARIASRLRTVNEELARLEAKETARTAAVKARRTLLDELSAVRDRIHQKRRAVVGGVVRVANESGGHLRVSVTYRQNGIRQEWTDWLRPRVPFKGTRLERLAACVTPMELVKLIGTRDESGLRAVNAGGEHFFDDLTLPPVLELADHQDDLLDAQVMRLEDRPEIQVREPGGVHRSFDHLSAGQQRSVLLSLLLCANRFEPLVVDQPEDHLDAAYISHAIVHHLEQAKERRQVILATHSANLAVLGDAELIIPMTSDGRRGAPQSPGAVDRPDTMEQVCALLEGGLEAYQRRGHRYGFEIRPRT
jgi:predicted nuclease with RNAse H fold